MKTSYIAVIAIVIVAVAGVGVYFAFFNNEGGSNLDVDVVKTTVAVDDYTQFGAEMTQKMEKTEEQTLEEFISYLYMPSESKLVGTEVIVFNGERITCNVYQDDLVNKWWNEPETGVTYKLNIFGAEMVLSQTNLDLSKTVEEQQAVKGSFITWKTVMTMPTSSMTFELVGTTTNTVTAVNEDVLTVSEKSEAAGKFDMKLTVTAIDGDNLEINDGEDEMTKTEFFGKIDLESYKQMLKEQGVKYVMGEVVDSRTIKTPFGERHVVTQEFTIFGEDDDKVTYEITYGDKGVIYSVSHGSSETLELTLTLKASSLITKA